MSAAARGAAGYRFMHRRRGPKRIRPKAGEVRTFARMLQDRLGMTAERAWQLAEEQAQKRFPKAAA